MNKLNIFTNALFGGVIRCSIRKSEVKNKYYFVLFCAVFFFSNNVYSAEILEDVSYKKKGGVIEITAQLNVPLSYVKHFPRKRGKIIQIQLKADKQSIGDVNLKRREMIQPSQSAPIEIRDVIYEGNVRGGPYLVFRFKSVVEFSVRSDVNSKIIRVLIKSDKVKEKKLDEVKNADVKKDQVDDAKTIMKAARVALTKGQNAEAILLFSKLLSIKNHKYLADAKEYLGLARERNGQLELARKEYQEYLKLYPKEHRANTVKQRLMTLSARLSTPKRNLRESKKQATLRSPDQKRVDTFGRVSQTYYYGAIKSENSPTRDQQNTLLSFLDFTRRERDQNKETRLVFSGSHEIDILAGARMEARVRSIYAEYKGKKNGLELSLGRQTVNSGGVLGRFDGGLIGVKIKPKIRGYLVGGWPVDFQNHREIQTKKPMLGARVDFNELIPNWKMSSYAIRQNIGNIINRAAIGGDVRYFFNKKIFYSLVDYDASYNVVNFFTVHYGWQATAKAKFDIHFDRRRSPVMLTTNALQGLSVQTVTTSSVDENGNPQPGRETTELNFPGFPIELPLGTPISIKKLQALGIPEANIRDQAIRNTGRSTLITFTARYTIKKDLTLNSYITLSKYEEGVNQTDSTSSIPKDTSFLPSVADYDYALTGQLLKNNFFKPRGILIGGGRLSNNVNSQRVEANTTFRIPVKGKWWTDYKLRIMYTVNKTEDKQAVRISPRFKLDYRYTRKLAFDLGLGVDFNKSEFEGQDYVFTMFNSGFRYLF